MNENLLRKMNRINTGYCTGIPKVTNRSLDTSIFYVFLQLHTVQTSAFTHTHTHTHTQARTNARARTHTHARTHAHIHTHTHIGLIDFQHSDYACPHPHPTPLVEESQYVLLRGRQTASLFVCLLLLFTRHDNVD